MSVSPFRRKIVPLVLAFTLSASWASAGPRAGGSLVERLGRAWSLLVNDWGKTGCHIDPSGGWAKATTPTPSETDEDCNIDPNGLCVKAADSSPFRTDTGCHIDPNGLCR